MLIIKILIKVCCRHALMTKPWSSTSRKRRMRFGCWTFGGNYWFLKYKWKENLSGDVIAGVTMAIIQIPQGKTDNKGCFLLLLSKVCIMLEKCNKLYCLKKAWHMDYSQMFLLYLEFIRLFFLF